MSLLLPRLLVFQEWLEGLRAEAKGRRERLTLCSCSRGCMPRALPAAIMRSGGPAGAASEAQFDSRAGVCAAGVAPGGACQFDWAHEIVVGGGVTDLPAFFGPFSPGKWLRPDGLWLRTS